jgi:mitotic spindle assembly checkpoint protein MAD2B
MPSQPSSQHYARGRDQRVQSDLGGVKTIPLRTVEAGEFILECWIEEGRAKVDQSSQIRNNLSGSR